MRSLRALVGAWLPVAAAFAAGALFTGVATGHTGSTALLHSGHSDSMNGTLTAKGFRYAAPKTGRLVVPAAAFDHVTNNGGQITLPAFGGARSAPVMLPDRSVVTKVEWFYDTNTSAGSQLQLEVWDPAPGAESNMVTLSSGACGDTPCSSSTTVISSPTINNRRKHYVVTLFPGSEELTTFKIVITYRLGAPVPGLG